MKSAIFESGSFIQSSLLAAVRGSRGEGEVPSRQPAEPALSEAEGMPALHIIESGGAQNFFCHFYIVEWIRTFARDLHLLMAFTGKQDDVSGARFADGEANRFAPIDFDNVFRAGLLQTDQGVINDGSGIFARESVSRTGAGARVITLFGCGGAGDKFASERGKITECIVGVGVIH